MLHSKISVGRSTPSQVGDMLRGLGRGAATPRRGRRCPRERVCNGPALLRACPLSHAFEPGHTANANPRATFSRAAGAARALQPACALRLNQRLLPVAGRLFATKTVPVPSMGDSISEGTVIDIHKGARVWMRPCRWPARVHFAQATGRCTATGTAFGRARASECPPSPTVPRLLRSRGRVCRRRGGRRVRRNGQSHDRRAHDRGWRADQVARRGRPDRHGRLLVLRLRHGREGVRRWRRAGRAGAAQSRGARGT